MELNNEVVEEVVKEVGEPVKFLVCDISRSAMIKIGVASAAGTVAAGCFVKGVKKVGSMLTGMLKKSKEESYEYELDGQKVELVEE